ncbi:hypothetical protein [Corynebacterium cystitidis]|uniref:hypothetical protein n=1 Tax=Corynebacterium cystitidis TaxID=35757 RepID=UPI00115F7B08|nr:hypothetical protein [Corynebacterium cystitidis]
MDRNLAWNGGTAAAEGAACIALASQEKTEAVIEISDEPRALADSFLRHTIAISDSSIQIAGHVESKEARDPDNPGLIGDLGWSNKATLQFRSPEGFALSDDRLILPTSIELLITPPFS